MKIEVHRATNLTVLVFVSCIFLTGLFYLIKFPKSESVEAGWRNLKLSKDIDIKIGGSFMPVRVLCVDPAHVYVLYQGRFYALNGMATEMGNERLRSEYGAVPVSARLPSDLRMSASDLIQSCDDWF